MAVPRVPWRSGAEATALPSAGDPHPARPPRPVGVERRRALAGAGRPAAQRARRAAGRRSRRPRVDAVDAVWASDLARARRTAEIVAARARHRRASSTPRLRERHAGEWQGRTRAEIERAGRLPRVGPPARRATSPTTSVLARVLGGARRDRGCATTATCSWSPTAGVVRALERHLGGDADGLIPNLGGPLARRTTATRRSLGDRVVLLDDVAGHPPRADLTAPERIWTDRSRA